MSDTRSAGLAAVQFLIKTVERTDNGGWGKEILVVQISAVCVFN